MEWLVQYRSLGFDQRQEKSQKTQSQTAGGQVCRSGKKQSWEWKKRVGEGGREGANLAAWAEYERHSFLEKTHNWLLGAGNRKNLCCMCDYDGLSQQFYSPLVNYKTTPFFPCGHITEGFDLLKKRKSRLHDRETYTLGSNAHSTNDLMLRTKRKR